MNILNISAVKAIIIRHLFSWRRDLDRLVDSFWWPLLDMLSWGITSTYLHQHNDSIPNIVSFFVGGMIFWTFTQQAQRDMTMPILDEAWNKNLVNIFTTPLRLRELIVGAMCLGMIRLSISIAVLLTVASLFFHFNIFSFGTALIFSVINLILVGWWVGFIINGLILRYGFRVQAFAWALLFIIYPFSAVFYPVSILPEWAQIFSRLLPTTYIFENMRSVLFSAQYSWELFAISFLLNMWYMLLAILFLYKMFQDALKNARLVRLN